MDSRRHISGTQRLVRAIGAAACAGGLALAEPASALDIATQGFDGAAGDTPYIVLGGGGSGADFWGLASTGDPGSLTGFDNDYFAGRDLNSPFGGGLEPRSIDLGPIDLSPFFDGSAFELSILVAAEQGVWEATNPDYLRIILVDNGAGGFETVLEEFLPTGNANSDLASTLNPGTTLTTTAQEFVVELPAVVDTVNVRIEAYSTGDLEIFGFDDITIRRRPEPETGLLLSLGLIVLGFRQRRRGQRAAQAGSTRARVSMKRR